MAKKKELTKDEYYMKEAIRQAKKAEKIMEVPISYQPRTNEEGKKIGFKDGVRAIICILKYH